MAKRTANTDLNHDNWNEEDEPEDAGTFAQADNDTLKGRVIKKAKRRGIGKEDGAPSIFAGFGGFKSAASTESKAGFDFLAKKSSNGSSDSPAAATFNFSSPAASGFAFGQSPASKPSDSSSFSFGKNGSSSSETTKSNAGLFSFGSGNVSKAESGDSSESAKKDTITFGNGSIKPSSQPLNELFKPKEGSWKCKTCDVTNDSDKAACVACTSPKPAEKQPANAPKWTCKDCWVSNDDDKDKCVCCQASKPSSSKAPAAAATLAPVANPISLPKSDKWNCPTCMVPNDPDKEQCICCSEPKPGCKPRAVDSSSKPSAPGSVTSSGFKFGSSSTPSNPASSGFNIGSNQPKHETEKKDYSKEYLAHLKALNVQICTWIKTHIDKNPYVFLSPVFKDYEKHLKEIETKHQSKEAKSSEQPPAPLLGAVFGKASSASVEPVKFGSGSSGFAFSAPKGDEPLSKASGEAKSGFSFATSGEKPSDDGEKPKSGFTFGAAKASDDDKPKSGFTFGAAKSEESKASGFSFGTKPVENASSGFSFGAKSDTGSAGFSFGTKSDNTAGFSFGTKVEETKSAGFTFGSSKQDDKFTSAGFSFGAKSTDSQPSGFSFGSTASSGFSFGSAAASSTAAKPSEESKGGGGEQEEDEPPKVEVNQVVEEDAFHSVRCKLFYKKEKEFIEKGLGMLHLKKVDGGKTQLVVRAETNLGNILLNILVSDKMNIMKRKNNLQFGCIPNPPIPGLPEGPVIMLVKVKDALMADQLEEKLQEAMKA